MSVNQKHASIRIRRALVEDVELIRQCAQAAYQPYVSRIGKAPAPMVDDFLARVRDRDVRIAEHQNRFVGFAIFTQRNKSLFLENIAVSPTMQKLGIGTAMLNYLEFLAKRAHLEAIELYTNAKMTENLSLYPALGFECVDQRVEDGFERVYYRKSV